MNPNPDMSFSEVAEDMHAVASEELAGRAAMDHADILAEIRSSTSDDDFDDSALDAEPFDDGPEDRYLDAAYEDRTDDGGADFWDGEFFGQ